MRITPTLLALGGAVWHLNNRLRPLHQPSESDLGKQLVEPFPLQCIPTWVTLLLPTYLLFSNQHTSSHVHHVLEHCVALYIMVLVVNTVKRTINPYDASNTIDYILPLNVLLTLAVCYLSIVPSQYTNGFFAFNLLVAMWLRLTNPASDIATSAMLNDIILCTLVFMIYKRDLNGVHP
jgi:hypothetical protein